MSFNIQKLVLDYANFNQKINRANDLGTMGDLYSEMRTLSATYKMADIQEKLSRSDKKDSPQFLTAQKILRVWHDTTQHMHSKYNELSLKESPESVVEIKPEIEAEVVVVAKADSSVKPLEEKQVIVLPQTTVLGIQFIRFLRSLRILGNQSFSLPHFAERTLIQSALQTSSCTALIPAGPSQLNSLQEQQGVQVLANALQAFVANVQSGEHSAADLLQHLESLIQTNMPLLHSISRHEREEIEFYLESIKEFIAQGNTGLPAPEQTVHIEEMQEVDYTELASDCGSAGEDLIAEEKEEADAASNTDLNRSENNRSSSPVSSTSQEEDLALGDFFSLNVPFSSSKNNRPSSPTSTASEEKEADDDLASPALSQREDDSRPNSPILSAEEAELVESELKEDEAVGAAKSEKDIIADDSSEEAEPAVPSMTAPAASEADGSSEKVDHTVPSASTPTIPSARTSTLSKIANVADHLFGAYLVYENDLAHQVSENVLPWISEQASRAASSLAPRINDLSEWVSENPGTVLGLVGGVFTYAMCHLAANRTANRETKEVQK